MYLRALEFSSQENEQPPKLGSCSRIYFCKEYSKAKLCGKKRIFASGTDTWQRKMDTLHL